MVVDGIAIAPVEPPPTPSPAIGPDETNIEADSKGEVRPTKPDSRIRVPARPRYQGITVNQPWIICGNVNHLGIRRLNGNRRVLVLYSLLRSGLQIARCLRPLTHHLHGVHHVLLLIVVRVAKRGSPRKVLVHISQDRRECRERLDAGVPRLWVYRLTQRVAFHVGIRLQPSIRLDHLLGEGRRRQDLGHQRVRIQRDRRDQLLQLVGSLLSVGRNLRGLRILLREQRLRAHRKQKSR